MPDPPDPLEPYWAALGKFLHRYAQAETTVFNILRVVAGLTHHKATALFSGTRMSDTISFIRRIHEADGQPLSPWLEKALPKLSQLTTARNEILHQGFSLNGDKIIVTNRQRTMPRATTERQYTVEDLIDMEADTCVAHACLNMHWLESRFPRSRKAMHQREKEIATTAWRYKSPQPAPRRRKTPKAARKSKGPPQS